MQTVLISFPRLGWIRFATGEGSLNKCDLQVKKAGFIWKCVKKYGNYKIVR